MLVWIDLETTGLNPSKEHVIEVACIVTDDHLSEVARWERVVRHWASDILAHVDPSDDEAVKLAHEQTEVNPHVVKMHASNGLWRASAASHNTIVAVEQQLAEFIRERAVAFNQDGTVVQPQLAGSTVSFDRSFLERHTPLVAAQLHYRNVDVSTLNELARRLWPELHAGRPRSESAHRAMGDIELSLDTCRYYASHLGPVRTGLL